MGKLPLPLVTPGQGQSLLGRDWLSVLKLSWKKIFSVCTSTSLQAILDTFSEVFEDGLGTVQGVSAKIHVDPEATPHFYKGRPLLYRTHYERKSKMSLTGCDSKM